MNTNEQTTDDTKPIEDIHRHDPNLEDALRLRKFGAPLQVDEPDMEAKQST